MPQRWSNILVWLATLVGAVYVSVQAWAGNDFFDTENLINFVVIAAVTLSAFQPPICIHTIA